MNALFLSIQNLIFYLLTKKMIHKFLKKKTMILTHIWIDNPESVVKKYKEVNNLGPEIDAMPVIREKFKEAEIVDLTGNNITSDYFAQIYKEFPFPNVKELYLVFFA